MLTNEGANALQDATGLWFYDRVLGNPEVDYSAQYRGKLDDARRAAEAAIRRPDPPAPPGGLGDYAGHYRSPALKAATIAVAGGSLRLSFEATRYALILRAWNGEVFSLDSEDRLIAVSLVSDGTHARAVPTRRGRQGERASFHRQRRAHADPGDLTATLRA